MSRVELNEHVSYWKDAVKIECYRRALAAAVAPGDVVLDLGCGTGLLGLLACEAGASRVYAVDAGPILNVAKEIAGRTPYADRIVHIQEFSTKVELPELVDVVVADQIGGMAFDAGTNEYFADARRRLTKPDARFVPSGFSIRIVPVTCAHENDELEFWRSRPLGFDLQPLAVTAANVVRQIWEQTTATFLGAPADIASFDSWDTSVIDVTTAVRIERSGTMHGVIGMFVAEMGPGLRMTNDPSSGTPMRHRWQDFMPIDQPVDVEPGDTVSIVLRADPSSYQITWSVRTERAGQVIAKSVHSTALGVFLGKEDLGSAPDAPPTRLEPWRWSIEAMAGGMSRDDLQREIAERFASVLGDERACRHFAEDVWAAVR